MGALTQIATKYVTCGDSSFLGCYVVSPGKYLPTFRRVVVPFGVKQSRTYIGFAQKENTARRTQLYLMNCILHCYMFRLHRNY